MDWLRRQAQCLPEKPALIWNSQVWSFRQLDQATDEWVKRLAGAGVATGQHVGMLLPNRPETIILVYALARLKCVLAPFNIRLALPEVIWQAEHGNCSFILFDESRQNSETAGKAIWLNIDLYPEWSKLQQFSVPPMEKWNSEDVQAILFTSGTSGHPKAVQITFANHFWNATASAFRLGVLPDDRWVLNLPLYHIGGLSILFRSCLYGTAIILHRSFDPMAVLEAIREQRATILSLVPTMLKRILDVPGAALSLAGVRYILLGGAAAQPDLLQRALEAGIKLAVTYGMTEASSQIATATPEQTRQKPGCSGKPLFFNQLRIVGYQGEDLSAGKTGQIFLSGPTLMAGYLGQESPTPERWFATGDMGYLDNEGDLWVVQRRDDLIISGGENIYPVQVERALMEHPAVELASVVGIGDDDWGQVVGALVILRSGMTANENELLAHCRQRLGSYKTPRRLRIVEKIPQNENGKILRKEAAALLEDQV